MAKKIKRPPIKRARLKEARASVSFCRRTGFWPGSAARVAAATPTACFCSRLYAVSRRGLAPREQRFDISAMSRDDATGFRPRTGRIRDHGRASAPQSRSFVAQVMKAAAKANGGPLTQAQLTSGKPRGRGSGKGKCSRIGRDQAVADRLKRQGAERSPSQRQRRVVVKARIVRHRIGSGAAGVLEIHLERQPM